MPGPWIANSIDEAKAHIANVFGYTFRNDDLLREALYVDGFIDIGGREVPQGNKALASLGDAVLGAALRMRTYYLEMTPYNADEARKRLLRNKKLNDMGRTHGLHRHINRSVDATKPIAWILVSDTVEAVFGAMLLDSDLNLRITETGMDMLGLLPKETTISAETDAKT